jgi:hypothetical protein
MMPDTLPDGSLHPRLRINEIGVVTCKNQRSNSTCSNTLLNGVKKMKYFMIVAAVVGLMVSGTFAVSQLPPEPVIKHDQNEQRPDDTVKPKPPVPVAVGKEDEKPSSDEKKPGVKPAVPIVGGDSPPAATTENEEGLLPLPYIRNRLENLKVGQTGFVALEALRVDPKRRCYLDPNYLFGTQTATRPISVRRDANGYHVTLEGIEHQWVAQEIPQSSNLLPVKTVTTK